MRQFVVWSTRDYRDPSAKMALLTNPENLSLLYLRETCGISDVINGNSVGSCDSPKSPIHFSPMADFHYYDDEFRVSDFIDNPVIVDPQTPYPFEPFERFAVDSSRFGLEFLDLPNDLGG